MQSLVGKMGSRYQFLPVLKTDSRAIYCWSDVGGSEPGVQNVYIHMRVYLDFLFVDGVGIGLGWALEGVAGIPYFLLSSIETHKLEQTYRRETYHFLPAMKILCRMTCAVTITCRLNMATSVTYF